MTNVNQDSTNGITLLPCPFCGGEAQFRIFDTICNVECSECFNGTRYYALDDYEQAVAAWNARAERTCKREKHGRKMDGSWRMRCSECGYGIGDMRWSHCPNCGARIEVDA